MGAKAEARPRTEVSAVERMKAARRPRRSASMPSRVLPHSMPRPTEVVMRLACASVMPHAHCSGCLMNDSSSISIDSAVQHSPVSRMSRYWKRPMPIASSAVSVVYVGDAGTAAYGSCVIVRVPPSRWRTGVVG